MRSVFVFVCLFFVSIYWSFVKLIHVVLLISKTKFYILHFFWIAYCINPNLPRGKEGRMEKKFARSAPAGVEACTRDLPLARRESPAVHAMEVVRQASLSVPIDRLRQLCNTMCTLFWR